MCNFCLENKSLEGKILCQNDLFYCVESIDPVLRHAGMIIPFRHIATPFEMTDQEWSSLKNIIDDTKAILDSAMPDGYNIGWNIGEAAGQNVEHVHLHIIARFKDEPLCGKGIRYAFKQESNRRPN
jgi:diadenosine tetraphosphate (Ap4A) HIT family hydrolase